MAAGAVTHKETIRTMHDQTDTSRQPSDAARLGHWLRTRPAESWLFFAAGLVIGSLFL